jgi:hypothetical protein
LTANLLLANKGKDINMKTITLSRTLDQHTQQARIMSKNHRWMAGSAPVLSLNPIYAAVLGAFMIVSPLAQAQVDAASGNRYVPVLPQTSSAGASIAVLDGMYAANAKVGRIHVKVRNAGAPADGTSELTIDVTVYDLKDQLMTEPVLVTIENSGGRLQLLGSPTDEFGPSSKDADRLVPGTQLKVLNGSATFSLIAPSSAQDVTLRLTAGVAQAQGLIPFGLDLRDMIAAGLIEGSLRLSKQTSASTISPVRINDGFEQEITRLSRSTMSANGNQTTYAARAALFLKGKISGDTLLTMSYDTDKETRARLLADIRPEEFYPVYGDASIKGFEARSSDRLYVRVDKDRSFAMYGDFNTADGFSQSAGTGVVAGTNMRQLATYNRTLTGLKGHAENKQGFINAFAAYDTLKNVTEEIPTNGTSGPFAVKNISALENSEKVEVLVRDRNNLGTILSVTALARLNDYVFEPFSARILLNRALPSFDSSGNPMSLRISYEVDQGGDKFLVAGVDGQFNVSDTVAVGGAYIQDKNPNAPVTIAGVNAGVKLSEKTTLIAEFAQSKVGIVTAPIAIPAVNPGTLAMKSGNAARLELKHVDQALQASAYVNRTDTDFANTSAGTASNSGTQQIGAKASYIFNPIVTLNGDVQRSNDLATDANRLGATVGLTAKLNDTLAVRVGLRRSQEHGVLAGTVSGIDCNSAAGSTFAPASGGGFTGANSSTLLNLNGNNCTTAATSTGSTTNDSSSNTLVVGVDAKLTDKLGVSATLETGRSDVAGVNGTANRVELGATYQVAERTRVYARADSQRGLASQYAVDTTNKSSSLSLGIDSTYMQGGNVFSEYRLSDAIDGRQAQIASGLRNAWQIGDGLLLSTGAERLKLLAATGTKVGQNATALTAGLDYTKSELWKAGGKIEWRRLNNPAAASPDLLSQDTLLINVNAARKLDREWTLLGRNYYLATDNHGQKVNGWQDRFQIGFAYRPVDNTRFDALAKLEYKTENYINADNEYRKVIVGAVHANYHPSRPWWVSGRVAGKSVNEQFPTTEGGGNSTYKAFLVGGRVMYDITEKIDLGLNLSFMTGKANGQNGSSLQKSIGLEAGYALASNLWASVGYNASGYTDKDLASDYTGKGTYLRLRYKFDQDLLQSGNPFINNTLERPAR